MTQDAIIEWLRPRLVAVISGIPPVDLYVEAGVSSRLVDAIAGVVGGALADRDLPPCVLPPEQWTKCAVHGPGDFVTIARAGNKRRAICPRCLSWQDSEEQ